jgi:dipeptidase
MCDTFVALPNVTADGSVIFAKNSDREANEAQQLEYHPAGSFATGERVQCTYLTIPQVKETNAVLLSRPFWMWGAEMGANEHGVVIGNEAVFTRLKVKKQDVLTGMDMLRLALERADSSASAKQVLIDLLGSYGQGGACGYGDKNFFYHNSFIIADKTEAWVLETAGQYWAAKKVNDYYAISNGLTIESDYDEIHPQAESFARRKGWVRGEFGFASAFSDWLFTTFSACSVRRRRASGLLKQNGKKISPATAMAHLRNHQPDVYSPGGHLLSNSICAHAGNPLTRHASQTTASLVAHLTINNPTFWVTATSAPCLSLFKPVWFNGRVVPNLGPVLGAEYNENSYWWRFEMVHRQVLRNYMSRKGLLIEDQQQFETYWLHKVYRENQQGFILTRESFRNSDEIFKMWLERINQHEGSGNFNLLYQAYWRSLNKSAGFANGVIN